VAFQEITTGYYLVACLDCYTPGFNNLTQTDGTSLQPYFFFLNNTDPLTDPNAQFEVNNLVDYSNAGFNSYCSPILYDGVSVGSEQCDDRNTVVNDGCTNGVVDAGWTCALGTDPVVNASMIACSSYLI
jgi:cysteine-rich repeat protein